MYKIYFFKYHAGMCGTDMAGLAIGESAEKVCDELQPEVEDWFWNFNDESDFEDMEPEVEGAWAEEYVPKKHDPYIHETKEDVARLQKQCDMLNEE